MAKFACCGQEFASEEALAQHQVKAHGQPGRVAGTCCGIDFYTEEGLKEHLRAAHGKAS